jgi:hypothetical protein
MCLAIAGFCSLADAQAQTFLGFRLLDLEGHAVRWGGDSEGNIVVSYALASKEFTSPGARNCGEILPLDGLLANSKIAYAAFEAEVRAAFDMWQKVANIRFERTSDFRSAGIVIGALKWPEGRAYANVTEKPTGGKVREIERSLICLNPDKRWKIGFDGDLTVYDLRFTIAHEIGHAIGLDHPENDGQLMSFRYQERSRALQDGDIRGALAIYGARRPAMDATSVAATR